MQIDHLTDQELLNYLDLTSTDPIVRRLCDAIISGFDLKYDELREQVIEAEDNAEYYEDLYKDAQSELRIVVRENNVLREKLNMWNILGDDTL
jgi:hypothetical protein